MRILRLFAYTLTLTLLALPLGWWVRAANATWRLADDASTRLVADAPLRDQIFHALDAAEKAGNDPHISGYPVRAATAFEKDGAERAVVGGNTEYQVPEAIHAETSLLNHVTALYGADATRKSVRFVAFYREQGCSGVSASCGDCRDYQLATTDYEHLLVACGQASDHTVHVTRFIDQLVCEKDMPIVDAKKIPLPPGELNRLVTSVRQALEGGVTLFSGGQHTAAAALSATTGKLYRAAAADDAAFHYRYPIGGVLQQAATERDYFIRAIVVAGARGQWPRVSYRDRQYGYEASSFNRQTGKPPILLILTNSNGEFRMTTFETALPKAFSTSAFMPEAVKKFLETHR